MKSVCTLLLLLLSSQLIFSNAIAGRATSLYNVDIPVVDESSNSRYGAFKKGMNEVFIRISGDSFVMDKLKPPAASRYVKQFSYEPLDPPKKNAAGELLMHVLKIQYNGSLMMKYLLDKGFPVWGEHRSDAVIWLAVRDGQSEYVLKESDQSLLKTTMDKALLRRGVPARWPLYDYKDQKALTAADIRGGFRDPITRASERYSRGPALAGSMIWNGKQWQSNWSLLMDGDDQYWNMVDTDYEQLVNKAVDRAANAMGNVYAVHDAGKDQHLIRVRLDVQAITSVAKYRKVENYLLNLSVVASVNPLRVDAQSAMFELLLRSDEQDLLKLLHNDAELIETEAIKPQPVKSPPVEIPAEAPGPETLEPEISGSEKTASEKTAAGKDVAANTGSEKQAAEALTPEDPVTATPDTAPQDLTPVYYYRLIH
ncbi:MAG: DUF2066 domain-containing protein [Proteobacteria bacterium]|nr:DUF2066 domain-containing protein [Pseudomonadota bacterium]